MDAVNQVALWAGFISSIVSIVLSVVAIIFAILVDRGAREVTSQTIKSLQKIEADVERVSNDTRDLIKAGWDRMLGSVPLVRQAESSEASKLASGVSAEITTELRTLVDNTDISKHKVLERKINDVLDAVQGTLALIEPTYGANPFRDAAVSQLHSQLQRLSPQALALAVMIFQQHHHLEAEQYQNLRDGGLGRAVRELRRTGLLEPHVAAGKDDSDPPVYFFPSRVIGALGPALSLMTAPSDTDLNAAVQELRRIGFWREAKKS